MKEQKLKNFFRVKTEDVFYGQRELGITRGNKKKEEMWSGMYFLKLKGDSFGIRK